jgi:hypothetical protein
MLPPEKEHSMNCNVGMYLGGKKIGNLQNPSVRVSHPSGNHFAQTHFQIDLMSDKRLSELRVVHLCFCPSIDTQK